MVHFFCYVTALRGVVVHCFCSVTALRGCGGTMFIVTSQYCGGVVVPVIHCFCYITALRGVCWYTFFVTSQHAGVRWYWHAVFLVRHSADGGGGWWVVGGGGTLLFCYVTALRNVL